MCVVGLSETGSALGVLLMLLTTGVVTVAGLVCARSRWAGE